MKKSIKKLVIFIIPLLLIIATAEKIFAQAPTKTSDKGLGCGGGMGPIAEFACNLTSGGGNRLAVGTELNRVMSFIIGFLTIIAGLWFAIQFIISGYGWISSAGDKGKLETAQKRMTYSILGLGVVVTAWIIIGLIGRLAGLDILNPGEIIQTLGL